MQFVSWFLADPRRLCVLGVWVNLAGFAASLFAVVQGGFPAAGAALLLFLGAAGLKAYGLQRFKVERVTRHRSAGAFRLLSAGPTKVGSS